MHVVFLNRAFPPDLEATGQYLAELTEDLSRDHRVSVICGRPNTAELSGRVFPFRMEQYGRVEVLRAWGTRWPKGVPIARMANHASFYLLATKAARRLETPDIVISFTDPPFLGLLALRLKRRFGIPFIHYCQDIYPDVAQAVGMAPRLLAATFERVQQRILKGADKVIALGDDMSARLRSKGVTSDRVTIIRNWADVDAIRPIKRENPFRRSHGFGDRFVVMYSGNFGYVWDLDVVLDAAARLRDDLSVLFVLIGGGSLRPRIEDRVRGERLHNVRILPFQPKDALSTSLSAADLHLVPMRRRVYGTVVPSKIYGILAAGTPFIALAEAESEAARVIRTHRCGWQVEPGDAGALAHYVRYAAHDRGQLHEMGRRAREAAESNYSRTAQTAQFADLLDRISKSRPVGSASGSVG